jgi:hypothetical protein
VQNTPDAEASIAPPALTFVTIAKRPLVWAEDGATPASDLPDVTSGIFFILGLDIDSANQNSTYPTGNGQAFDHPSRRSLELCRSD